jgi:hypothetical protein
MEIYSFSSGPNSAGVSYADTMSENRTLKEATGYYEVERRALHAERPGFRISELQISAKQKVPGITRAMSRTPFSSSMAVDAHHVINGGTTSATFLVLQGIGEYDFVPLV